MSALPMKVWYESKTVWFAVLFGVIQVAGLFGYADYTPSTDVAEIVGVIVSVVMLILRFVTTSGVRLRR